jgi:hypothetical protein
MSSTGNPKRMATEIIAHLCQGWNNEQCIVQLLRDLVTEEWNYNKSPKAYGDNMAFVAVATMRDLITVLDMVQDAVAQKCGCPDWKFGDSCSS